MLPAPNSAAFDLCFPLWNTRVVAVGDAAFKPLEGDGIVSLDRVDPPSDDALGTGDEEGEEVWDRCEFGVFGG